MKLSLEKTKFERKNKGIINLEIGNIARGEYIYFLSEYKYIVLATRMYLQEHLKMLLKSFPCTNTAEL